MEATRSLDLKYARKQSTLSVLSGMLRDWGGFEYKSSIADTIITVIEKQSRCHGGWSNHICEFIEKCEHTSLAVRILHLLGREGQRSKQPSKYIIRIIYNRVILENAAVRAGAVSALIYFGATCEDLLPSLVSSCAISPFAFFGPQFKSFALVELTESEPRIRCSLREVHLCSVYGIAGITEKQTIYLWPIHFYYYFCRFSDCVITLNDQLLEKREYCC